MYFYDKKYVTRILCSLLLTIALLAVFYKASLPNFFILNNGTEPQSSVDSNQQRVEDTWRKTIENKMVALKKALEMLWCQTTKVQSNGGFCVTAEQLYVGGNQAFDPRLCSAVESLAGNGSIGDLGAGLGWYGMCLLREKDTPFVVNAKLKAQLLEHYKNTMKEKYDTPKVVSSWNGFDGAGHIEELSAGFVRQTDLSEENLWLGRQWDWVMSVEVGEHIPASKEKAFLDNIVRHACKGVLLTWAVEGQGGHSHVNERNNDYIVARMKERGLVTDNGENNKIRAQLKLSWLKKTVMVFRFAEHEACNADVSVQ